MQPSPDAAGLAELTLYLEMPRVAVGSVREQSACRQKPQENNPGELEESRHRIREKLAVRGIIS